MTQKNSFELVPAWHRSQSRSPSIWAKGSGPLGKACQADDMKAPWRRLDESMSFLIIPPGHSQTKLHMRPVPRQHCGLEAGRTCRSCPGSGPPRAQQVGSSRGQGWGQPHAVQGSLSVYGGKPGSPTTRQINQVPRRLGLEIPPPSPGNCDLST